MKHSYLRLHASILLAGATGLFGKIITISELPLVFYRVLFSALLLAFVMGVQHRLHRLPWRQVAMMMGCGVLLAVHWVCYYGSIKMANVSIGAVCFALVGFFTAIIEPIIGRHRPSWRELLLSLLTVCGIMLIFGFDVRYRAGIAVGCLSSLLYSFFSVLSKRVQATTGRASSTMLLYEPYGWWHYTCHSHPRLWLGSTPGCRCTVKPRPDSPARLRIAVHHRTVPAPIAVAPFHLSLHRQPEL